MDLDKIGKLIEFVGASRISELTVSENGTSVKILHGPAAAGRETVPPPAAKTGEAAYPDTAPTVVPSPCSGLFHRSPDPGAAPFVEVGDEVVRGQSLFIIEAMKVFNTVTAERDGRVVRILAGDGEDVELGQPLVEIA